MMLGQAKWSATTSPTQTVDLLMCSNNQHFHSSFTNCTMAIIVSNPGGSGVTMV